MADDLLVRGALPPAPQKKIWIHRVKVQNWQQFVALGDRLYGIWTHWVCGRTRPCSRDTGKCEHCERSEPARWRGYLHCLEDDGRTECFLEITANAWESFAGQIRERETVRGTIFRVCRTKGGARGRYVVELLERKLDPDKLPAERTPGELLRYLWGTKTRDTGPSQAAMI